MAKRGKIKVPKLGDLADKIRSAEAVVTEAEQVAVQTAVQDPRQTAMELSDIMQRWLNSDVPKVVQNDEQLALYYDNMLKSIMVRMLEALNRAFVILGTKLEMDGTPLKVKDLTDVISTLGHLMVEMKKASDRPGRIDPKSEAEVDALIVQKEEELAQLENS